MNGGGKIRRGMGKVQGPRAWVGYSCQEERIGEQSLQSHCPPMDIHWRERGTLQVEKRRKEER